MRKFANCLVIFAVTLFLMSTVALASGNVSFDFTDTTTTIWGTSDTTAAEGQNWDIRIDSISNHGVGRVFAYPSYDWGSGLYTYSSSAKGCRPAKKYDGVSAGKSIVWRMRQDTDYTDAFSCSGLFRP